MSKKILHLRSSGGLLGAENVIIELSKYSSDFGYQSVIGAIKNEEDPYPEFLTLARESKIKTIIFEGRGRLDFSRAKKIRRFIHENKIDILHCHGYKENFYGIIMPARVPKIATNHLWKKSSIRDNIYCLMDAWFLRFFTKVVGVSDEIVEEMKKYGIRNAIKIPNGVDIDKYTARVKSGEFIKKFNLSPDFMILGMISSLTPEKGHKIAINSLRNIKNKFPKIKFLIVGDGKDRFDIQNQVAKLGLEEIVTFAGKQSNIPEILSIIDIFLLPSLKEGLPMALLEAMAAGKAVIATRVGENANVITNKRTGMLIPPSNGAELEKAIYELLRNKDKRIEFGKNARESVVKHYSSKIMAKRYCDLYDSVIGS